METSAGPADPWGSHPLPLDGDTLAVSVGPLRLWVRCQGDEVWMTQEPAGWDQRRREEEAIEPEPPDGAEWTRWPVPDGTDEILLSPAFPDRPVVVQPELSFRLIQGARARIYVRVPLWVKVRLPGPDPVTLREVPSMILSDTWWGGFTEGELCYWLETQARRRVGPQDFEPHLAICPLQLVNRSEGDLNVDKLALRVAHLSVFDDGGRLWADETRVRYRGEAEGSEIDMSGRPPEEAPDSTRVASPRTPVTRGFRTRTFTRLKAISGLGGAFG